MSVRYGKRTVLEPFTDRIESGEWLGVIGPNGAGKSSLLRAIAGLVGSTGSIAIDGRDLAVDAAIASGRRSSPTCRRSR